VRRVPARQAGAVDAPAGPSARLDRPAPPPQAAAETKTPGAETAPGAGFVET